MPDIKIGLIGGSGLGEALREEKGVAIEVDTPFGQPSSPILSTRQGDVEVEILMRHGPGHLLNPSRVPYRANIYALKSLGVTHIIASGATGSLRQDIHPGELVIPDQLIDKTTQRDSTFYEHAAVHVEFAEPFCPVMRQWLGEAAKQIDGVNVHDGGAYVCMEGPAFSTRAESHMHRAWGGDLIGMTACPEAKLAREAEMAYALLALPTDYDCWKPHEPGTDSQKLLAEIMENLNHATEISIKLIKQALGDVTMLRQTPSPAREALKLAIWSNRKSISAKEVRRLKVLWGKYFA